MTFTLLGRRPHSLQYEFRELILLLTVLLFFDIRHLSKLLRHFPFHLCLSAFKNARKLV